MKLKILGLMMMVFAGLAVGADASDSRDSFIMKHQFRACDWWTSIQTNAGSGYACSMFPFTVNVPDAQDVERALRDAERRISVLEAKIGSLEKQLNQSE